MTTPEHISRMRKGEDEIAALIRDAEARNALELEEMAARATRRVIRQAEREYRRRTRPPYLRAFLSTLPYATVGALAGFLLGRVL